MKERVRVKERKREEREKERKKEKEILCTHGSRSVWQPFKRFFSTELAPTGV